MGKKKIVQRGEPLFTLPDPIVPELKFKPPTHPIWTENKARLIERYLYYFVLVTHHGTYIDGFAGPQNEAHPGYWAAKLVMETQPKWLRRFYLFEKNPKQVEKLHQLVSEQPRRDQSGKRISRAFWIRPMDCNEGIPQILDWGKISAKEATFCLLDQRTFECKWSTVKALAEYKPPGHNKIELFYFFANGWLGRALHATKTEAGLQCIAEWWGRDDWEQLFTMQTGERFDAMVTRFKKELGYKSVKAWPIFQRSDGGVIMYYMIHATDHPDAPKLMQRAYNNAVKPLEKIEELNLQTILQF